MSANEDEPLTGWRAVGHRVIFESDTPSGKAFDLVLILVILSSIAVVSAESVASIRQQHGSLLVGLEWGFTILFTIEYVLRLMCVARPLAYARSFFGIVDLLAILPTFVSLLIPGTQALAVIRTVRVLRVFRVLKLASYVRESDVLLRALYASRRKIEVFVFTVVVLVVIFGTLMYLIEGPQNGFTSIPRGIYWAIVTMTTVGYGDIAPQTELGQAVSAFIMILGYGIIAVPTGIVTAQLTFGSDGVSGQACPSCGGGGHKVDARFCRLCGSKI